VAGSVNKVILVGNLGNDPDVRTMQSGDKVVNLSLATSDTWKDKTTGERRENTQWHRIVVFNKGLVNVCENYLRKGSKIYIEGQLETRKWQDQSGQDKYTTEVVLRPYRSELTMLDSKGSGGGAGSGGGFGDNQMGGYDTMSQMGGGAPMGNAPQQQQSPAQQAPADELEDEIPF